jgi:hypothetical protein
MLLPFRYGRTPRCANSRTYGAVSYGVDKSPSNHVKQSINEKPPRRQTIFTSISSNRAAAVPVILFNLPAVPVDPEILLTVCLTVCKQ